MSSRTPAKSSLVVLHFGRKGCGKSYRAKRFVESATGDVAVWDPRAEWAGDLAVDAPRSPALLVRSMGRFLEVQAGKPQPLARFLVFQCRAHEFPRWCRWVLARGNMLAVVDELHLFAGPFDSPVKSGAFLELIAVSRHARVDVLGMAQRPKRIHGDVREQADQIVSFQCTEPNDLSYFSAKCGKAFTQGLELLRPREFRVWEA